MTHKNFLRSIITALLWLPFCAFGYSQMQIDMFEGKWQIEGKEAFEEWTMINTDSLSGKGFKMIGGNKIISEYLAIYKQGSDFYYSARVPNQNQGAAILFKWKETDDSCECFENPEHDFPQRIRYCFGENGTLSAYVSDLDGKGFTINFNKAAHD